MVSLPFGKAGYKFALPLISGIDFLESGIDPIWASIGTECMVYDTDLPEFYLQSFYEIPVVLTNEFHIEHDGLYGSQDFL